MNKNRTQSPEFIRGVSEAGAFKDLLYNANSSLTAKALLAKQTTSGCQPGERKSSLADYESQPAIAVQAAGIKSQEISQHYQEPIGAETPQGVIADGTAVRVVDGVCRTQPTTTTRGWNSPQGGQ